MCGSVLVHLTAIIRGNETSTDLGNDHCHRQVLRMSCYITKHHDARQSYVPFAGPNTINHGSHSPGVNDQLRKLGGEENQSIVMMKHGITFKSHFNLAHFFFKNLGPKKPSGEI